MHDRLHNLPHRAPRIQEQVQTVQSYRNTHAIVEASRHVARIRGRKCSVPSFGAIGVRLYIPPHNNIASQPAFKQPDIKVIEDLIDVTILAILQFHTECLVQHLL